MACNTHASSTCKSPANCGGNCKCGTAADTKIKVLRSSTMRGKTSHVRSYPLPKPTMQNMGGTP